MANAGAIFKSFASGMGHLMSGFYYNWGLAYARWGQPGRAMWYLNRAERLYAKSPGIYFNRGSIWVALGHPEHAILDFSEAILLDPQHMQAHVNRGLMYALVGKAEESGKDVERAVQLGADRASLESRVQELNTAI